MMQLRRATLLVAFSLLTSSTRAGAECARVLWMQVALSTGGQPVLLCLPDTVDPRGPKAKRTIQTLGAGARASH
jgi:hypothetical protein